MTENAEAQERRELEEGDFAPDFTLSTTDGSPLTLSTLRGKPVVLYFYPKDDTPGCTQEAKDFTCAADEFADLGVKIIGVSKDSMESHEKFAQKHELAIPLASDQEETVCEAYDCWVEKNMYGKKYMGIRRDTFLLDSSGKIVKIWRKVKVEGHVDEVLEEARKL